MLACPEYNYSIAPALKNALDWVSREPDCAPFNGKPVAIMGAGGGMGTSRAQYHLRQVCVYLNLRPVNKPEVFSNAFSASFNESGDLIDPSLQQQVTALMDALDAAKAGLRRGQGGGGSVTPCSRPRSAWASSRPRAPTRGRY